MLFQNQTGTYSIVDQGSDTKRKSGLLERQRFFKTILVLGFAKPLIFQNKIFISTRDGYRIIPTAGIVDPLGVSFRLPLLQLLFLDLEMTRWN